MNSKAIVVFSLLISISFSSCKKKSNIDPCIEKFVGEWSGSMQGSFSGGGGCSTGISIRIEPGSGSCQVLLPNLPDACYSSNYQVLGTISGDSLSISSQPFGTSTITGRGALYLNQFVFELNQANGASSVMSLTKQ